MYDTASLPLDTQRRVAVGRVGRLLLQGMANGLCTATLAILAQLRTRNGSHHVLQVANGLLLLHRPMCHDDVSRQEDVRTHARLAPALAVANEVEWVCLALNDRA